MSRTYISVADTSKMIRAALKRSFPGVKFSVRSSSYAGGASARVSWVDGPRVPEVEEVAKEFQGASFDSSQDLKTYHTDMVVGPNGLEEVRYGADFVFCERQDSPARQAIARAFLVSHYGADVVARCHPSWIGTAIYRACYDMDAAGNAPTDSHRVYIEDGWLYGGAS